MSTLLSERIYFVRQPIFSAGMKVVAYQLTLMGQVPPEEGEASAHQLEQLALLFRSMDWKVVSGGLPVIVQLPASLVQSVVLEALSPVKVVIGVHWRMLSASLYDQVRAFHFPLALREYDLTTPLPFDRYRIDFVIVNIHLAGARAIIQTFQPQRSRTRWIAAHVVNRKQFEFCRHYGFRFFEGSFFMEPRIIDQAALKPSQLKVLQLLQIIDDPGTHLPELVALLEQDVALSQQVVAYANGFLKGEEDHVVSIIDAVRRIGLRQLKERLTVLQLKALNDKPPEVVRTALIRGQFCRCIGRIMQDVSEDIYYTTGVFSLLDVMMDRPMTEILRELKLGKAVTYGILNFEGGPGRVLKLIMDMEMGRSRLDIPSGLVPEQVHRCYLRALAYADDIMRQVYQSDRVAAGQS